MSDSWPQIDSLWRAAEVPSDPLDELVYASNLLGSDPRITNFGGGNTSVKTPEMDPISGQSVEVLWVKASGGDLGSAKRANFASIDLHRYGMLEKVKSDQGLDEDAMVQLANQTIFGLNPAPPSIDTALHAFVPARAVAHLHSDAVIAIAAAKDCDRLTGEIYGDSMICLPWKRPGFDLGLMLRDGLTAQPTANAAMMKSHGFICWASSWEECYQLCLQIINQASTAISKKASLVNPFGDLNSSSNLVDLVETLPILRGLASFEGQKVVAHWDDSETVKEFVSSSKGRELAGLGTSCPDHFVRTKIRPLWLESGAKSEAIEASFQQFREGYQAYYERCKRGNSPAMRNPNPSIVLLEGAGMVSFGKSPEEARISGEFFKNAIAVMRGAETLSSYTSLPEQEAFDIEYWLLEEAKLKRQPAELELARHVAVITGGASGIGLATAKKLASLGALVVLLDINSNALDVATGELAQISSKERVKGVICDVTDLASIQSAMAQAVLQFGGIDIFVANAGTARRGNLMETTPEDFALLSNLLMKGYFDSMSEAAKVMVRQETGGSIIVVGSKNGVAAGSSAALYSAAKAFELHLMRVTAGDLAKHYIRCNAINPDGVVTGSGIWTQEWKTQTAKSLGIDPEGLVDYYAKRSLLGTVVTPEHCAEVIAWLASDARSSRTTGCVIPVDGGNKEGFLR